MELEPTLSVKAQYDVQLVKRSIEKNDQAAYAELLDRYKESVFYLLLKMVNSNQENQSLELQLKQLIQNIP